MIVQNYNCLLRLPGEVCKQGLVGGNPHVTRNGRAARGKPFASPLYLSLDEAFLSHIGREGMGGKANCFCFLSTTATNLCTGVLKHVASLPQRSSLFCASLVMACSANKRLQRWKNQMSIMPGSAATLRRARCRCERGYPRTGLATGGPFRGPGHLLPATLDQQTAAAHLFRFGLCPEPLLGPRLPSFSSWA